MEMKKEKEVNEKVNESMKQLSFTTSSSPSLSYSLKMMPRKKKKLSLRRTAEKLPKKLKKSPVVTAGDCCSTPPTISRRCATARRR